MCIQETSYSAKSGGQTDGRMPAASSGHIILLTSTKLVHLLFRPFERKFTEATDFWLSRSKVKN